MAGFQKLVKVRGNKQSKEWKKKSRKKQQLVVILTQSWVTEDIRVFVIVLADLQFNSFKLFLVHALRGLF